MEEEKDLGGIGIPFGQSKEIEIIVADIKVLFSKAMSVLLVPDGLIQGVNLEEKQGARCFGAPWHDQTYVDSFVRKAWRYGR